MDCTIHCNSDLQVCTAHHMCFRSKTGGRQSLEPGAYMCSRQSKVSIEVSKDLQIWVWHKAQLEFIVGQCFHSWAFKLHLLKPFLPYLAMFLSLLALMFCKLQPFWLAMRIVLHPANQSGEKKNQLQDVRGDLHVQVRGGGRDSWVSTPPCGILSAEMDLVG